MFFIISHVKVFRLKTENDEGCVELDFPDGDRHLGQKLLNIGSEAGKLVGKGVNYIFNIIVFINWNQNKRWSTKEYS